MANRFLVSCDLGLPRQRLSLALLVSAVVAGPSGPIVKLASSSTRLAGGVPEPLLQPTLATTIGNDRARAVNDACFMTCHVPIPNRYELIASIIDDAVVGCSVRGDASAATVSGRGTTGLRRDASKHEAMELAMCPRSPRRGQVTAACVISTSGLKPTTLANAT